MLNFDFREKDLGIVFPSHFVYDFSKNTYFMLRCINWPNVIAWLPFLLEILVNMRVVIVWWKAFFVIFKGLSIFKNFLRRETLLMLWNSISWSHLKLTVQIRALHPCEPFLINKHKVTVIALKNNVLLCRMWFKIFYWLQNLIYTAFYLYFAIFLHILATVLKFRDQSWSSKFSGQFFFRTSCREGEFHRDYLINIAT